VTTRLDTCDSAIVMDAFDDDLATEAASIPSRLDEQTLAFIARIQRVANERIRDAEARAQKAAAAAEHETKERVAAHFESMNGGKGCHVPSGRAAAEVRAMDWKRRAA
jgi:hypothetical protein